MVFKYNIKIFLLIIVVSVIKCSYANEAISSNPESSISVVESSHVNQFNSRANCTLNSILCDVSFGLKMAESQGVNGVILSGYAYHLNYKSGIPNVFSHAPSGVNTDGSNELALGVGYSRSFYNPNYNSNYSLFLFGFNDSYSQPQFQGGFYYQKYLDLTDSGKNKFGYGYNAAIMSKSAYTGGIPVPLYPLITPMLSLRMHDVDLQLNFAYVVLLLSVQINLPSN